MKEKIELSTVLANFLMPKFLHTELKVYAIKHGVTMSRLLTDWVASNLDLEEELEQFREERGEQ